MVAENSPQPSTRPGSPPEANLTARSVVLGLLMSAAAVGIVIWAEYAIGTIQIGYLQIPPVAVGLLFLVVLLNRLTGRIWPRQRLRPAELAVIYVMMVFASMVASRGVGQRLWSTMVSANYYATPANHWQNLIFPYIKPWLVPWNPEGGTAQPLVKYYYEGLPAGASIPWGPWVLPTLVWLVLFGFVYMAFTGMAAVMYKLWADEEHLAFPLTKLPLELVVSESGVHDFLRNPLTWLGFLFPAIYMGLNGLHMIWPQIPGIKTQVLVSFSSFPWSGMQGSYLFFSLAGVGLFYLLPGEMVFSLWFFYVFARLQEVAAAALIGSAAPAMHAAGKQFVADQTAGMYVALVGLMIYNSRARIADAWRRQAQGDPAASNTFVSLRTAVGLMIAAMVGIVLWWVAAGGTAVMALAEFGVYLLFQSVIMARATSEAGAPMTEGTFTPFDVWRAFSPALKVPKADLTLLAFSTSMFVRDLRGMALTGMMDAQNLADGVNMKRRKMVGITVGSLVFAVLLTGVIVLALSYTRSGNSMWSYIYGPWGNPSQGFLQTAPLLDGIEQFRPLRGIWILAGAVFCVFLGGMRRLYVWWPFHPLGAALSISWIMVVFWFPALVAWVVKTAITRYGGVRTYLKLRPLFLGFIFGEYVMAVFWTVISFLFQTTAPAFPGG